MVEVRKEVLVELLERIERATGPDRFLDRAIERMEHGPNVIPFTPEYTGSIDAAVALVEKVLPGWWWKIGTCCVSDDACIAPDFNSPVHGERLHRQFGPIVSGSEIDAGYDVDRRPPGNVPLALLESLLRALLAQAEKEAG